MTQQFPTVDILRYLLRFKWWFLGLVAVTTVAAYAYARTLPEYFKATINCVPPSQQMGGMGGMLGGISSTLKDIGLAKLGGSSGETYEFITILFTRTIRDSMIRRFDLVEEYKMQGDPMEDVRTEFDDNLEVEYHAEGNYEISIWSQNPTKSVEMCNAFIDYANQITNRIQRQEAEKTAMYMEQRIGVIDSVLAALTDSLQQYSSKYRLFSPLDQATASAKALAETKGELLKQEAILGILEQNYGKNDPQVRSTRSLVTQLQDQYERAQTQPGFAGNFALTDAAGVGASYLRMYADFEAHTKLKAFLLPSLEQAKLDINKAAPALLVVDTPVAPEERDRPKRAFIALGAGVGVGIFFVLILLAVRGWRMLMQRNDENLRVVS
jgi:capsule polysaccharide export protein KpsE/RkpR